jgi:hypothetical protein
VDGAKPHGARLRSAQALVGSRQRKVRCPVTGFWKLRPTKRQMSGVEGASVYCTGRTNHVHQIGSQGDPYVCQLPLGSERSPVMSNTFPSNKAMRRRGALKHGAYSELVLLPGEDPRKFRILHAELWPAPGLDDTRLS